MIESDFQKFEKQLDNIMNLAPNSESWSDLFSLMNKIYHLFLKSQKSNFDFNLLTNKKTLAKRLAQCLNPECPYGLHEISINIYQLILTNIKDKNENKLMDNLFLYSYGLFSYFPYGNNNGKKNIISKIIKPIFLDLNKEEKKLCLPGLLSALIEGLDQNNEEIVKIIYSVFECFVNSKELKRDFYGVFWMLLLKSKHLRNEGMKYLLEKITKYEQYQNLDDFSKKEIVENEYPNINITVINTLCELIKDNSHILIIRNTMKFILTRFPISKYNDMITEESKIKLITNVLHILIKCDYNTLFKFKKWIMGNNQEYDNHNEDMEYTKKLLILGFKNIFNSGKNIKEEKLLDYLKIIKNLYENDMDIIDFILPDIIYPIFKCVTEFWAYELNSSLFESNNIIIRTFKNFVNNCFWKSMINNLKEIIRKNYDLKDILVQLEFCLIFIEVESSNKKINNYIPIISFLLGILDNQKINRENFKQINEIVMIILSYVKCLQIDEINSNNINNNYYISEEYNLSNILKNTEVEIMDEFCNKITKFQEYYIDLLNEFSKIGNTITKFDINFFKKSSILLIKLLEYNRNEHNEIPVSIECLEKLVLLKNNNILLLTEAINILIDLNMESSLKSDVYLKIKNNFKNKDIPKSLIEQNINIKKMEVQPNCFEISLAKFYFLLKEKKNQKIIIDILLKMFKLDKDKFIQFINNTLNKNDEDFLSENIRLFNYFWKLLNDYYPDEILFKKGECIFKLIDLLDNKNPFLKNLSKIWLNQPNQCYDKIIDPFLLILLDQKIQFQENKNGKTIEFIENFEISRISDTFKKLKNIISNSSIMTFLENQKTNENILSKVKFESFKKDRICYVDTLISIVLFYIRAVSSENLGIQFERDMLILNYSTYEFLHFLIISISDKQFLLDNIFFINDTILYSLNRALNQKNGYMAIQILTVLKELYFQYPLEIIKKSNNKKIFLRLLNDNILRSSLMIGIINEDFYVKEYFLSFVEKAVETYFYFVKDYEKIFNYANIFIMNLSNLLFKRLLIDNNEKKETEKFSHYDKKNNKIIFKNYCEEYKDYKIFDENEILFILKGINNILSHSLNNKFFEKYKSDLNSNLNMDQLTEKIKLYDWAAYKEELEKEEKKIETKNYYEKVKSQNLNLIYNLISIWINESGNYKKYDYCLNDNGILAIKKSLSYYRDNHKQKIKFLNQSIKNYILKIAIKLFFSDSINFILNIINLWCNNNIDIKNKEKNFTNDKQYKLSIIELLISMNIPLDVIFLCIRLIIQKNLLKNPLFNINNYNKVDKVYETNIDMSIGEAKLFHFIYSYLALNQYNKNEVIFLNEILVFLNYAMNNTKILYSFCWIYEILNLSILKFDCTEGKSILLNFENLINNINSKLMNAIFSNILDSKYIKNNKLVLPFLPTIYTNIIKNHYINDDLYKKTSDERNKIEEENSIDNIILSVKKVNVSDNSEDFNPYPHFKGIYSNKYNKNNILNNNNDNTNNFPNEISKFLEKYLNFGKCFSKYNNENNISLIDSNDLNEIYSNLAFIILGSNFYCSTKKYYVDIINKLINLLISSNKNNFSSQFALKFLVHLLGKNSREIVDCSKDKLMDYFKNKSFFACNKNELNDKKRSLII